MAVQIEEVMVAKTGKSLRVKLGGTWYGAGLDSGLNGAKGQLIEAEIETGKFGPWIKGYAKVAAPGGAVQSATPPLSPPVAAPVPQYATQNANVAPWWWPSVSNVWAANIAAGNIKNHQDLKEWALAVKTAAKSVVSATVATQDEDIPF